MAQRVTSIFHLLFLCNCKACNSSVNLFNLTVFLLIRIALCIAFVNAACSFSKSPYLSWTSFPVRWAGPLRGRDGRCRGSGVHVRPTRSSASTSDPSLEPRTPCPRQPALRGPCTSQHHAQQHGIRCQRRSEEGQRPNIWVSVNVLIISWRISYYKYLM